MNQLDLAIDSTVHDYAGGTNELAELMGMSRTILNNKACPTNENHQFHPQQLISIQRLTGNWSITDAFVAAHDVWQKQNSPSAEKDVTQSLFDVAAEFGRMAEKVNEAMSDKVLTERERRDCLKEAEAMLEKCEALKSSLYREGLENKIHAA